MRDERVESWRRGRRRRRWTILCRNRRVESSSGLIDFLATPSTVLLCAPLTVHGRWRTFDCGAFATSAPTVWIVCLIPGAPEKMTPGNHSSKFLQHSRFLRPNFTIFCALLPAPGMLCFHPCLLVCLSVYLFNGVTQKLPDENFTKFHGIIEHNQGTNRVSRGYTRG